MSCRRWPCWRSATTRCCKGGAPRSISAEALPARPLAQGEVEPLWKGEAYRHERLRIGYVSSDFRDHPVAHQLVGLLENHDRDRFEILGFANGRADDGAMRQRIRQACDAFHDIGGIGSLEAAQLIRASEVDVLVDLNGQTLGWRPAIFKYRPAPVSATYLGYAGTTGADFIDYVIGDPQVTPFELAPGMSEKIVQLPHSFWPADPALPEPEQLSRAEAGLPEDVFVFCCFNANHKIRPNQFASWMRLLQAVPKSILWIRGGEPAMEARFLGAARAGGIDSARILFARREESFARHLGRMRRADLFLYKFPYNAQCDLASDALWAGLACRDAPGQEFCIPCRGGLPCRARPGRTGHVPARRLRGVGSITGKEYRTARRDPSAPVACPPGQSLVSCEGPGARPGAGLSGNGLACAKRAAIFPCVPGGKLTPQIPLT